MLSDLAFPAVLAVLFTVGAYAIHRRADHAENITIVLKAVATALLMLVGILMMSMPSEHPDQGGGRERKLTRAMAP